MGKGDALGDIVLQARGASLQQLLLLLGDVTQDIGGLLSAVGLLGG